MKTVPIFWAIATNFAVMASFPARAEPAFIGSHAQLNCHAHLGAGQVTWRLETDDTIPLAVVDDADAPAEYSPGHVHVRLSADGPSLFLARGTGRIVVTAADGRLLGVGHCLPITSAQTPPSTPLAATCPQTRDSHPAATVLQRRPVGIRT